MGLIAPALPSPGEPRGAGEGDVRNALQMLLALVNGGLDAANLADGAVGLSELQTAAKAALLAPGRTLGNTEALLQAGNNWLGDPRFGRNDGTIQLDNAHSQPVPMIVFRASDYAVAGLTTKLRLRMGVINNADAATVTITGKLYAMTSSSNPSGSDVGVDDAAVAGATVQIVDPAAAAEPIAVGANFDPPADGIYALGVETGGAMPAGRACLITLALELLYV